MFIKLFKRLWGSPTFTSWANMAVQAGSAFVILPLVLTKFTASEIAVYYLFATVMGLKRIFSFGFTPTLSRFIAYGRGGMKLERMSALSGLPEKMCNSEADGKAGANAETIEAAVASSRVIFLLLGLLALIVLGLVGTFAMQRQVELMASPEAGWMAWVVTVIVMVATIVFGYLPAYVTGMGEVALMQRWNAFFGVLSLLAGVLALLLGSGLFALVAARGSINLLTIFRNWFIARAIDGRRWRSMRVCAVSKPVMRVTWRAAWRSGLGNFSGYGVNHGLGVVYGQFATSAQLGSYLIAMRLLEMLSSLAQAPFYSKLPIFQQLFAAGKRDRLVELASRGMRISYWMYAAGSITILLLGEPLLELIRSNVSFPSFNLLLLLVIAMLLQRYGAMHLQLYTLSNHVVWHIASIGYGVIVLLIVVPLFNAFGVIGIALSFIGGELFRAPYCALRSYRMLETSFFTFERRISFKPVLTMVFVIMVAYLIN